MVQEENMTNYARIVDRLRGVRTREERFAMNRGLLLAGATVAGVLLAAFAIEAIGI